MAAPTVELLSIPGCPHHDAARELIERIAAEAGIDAQLRLVEVTSIADAERIRFLGSPRSGAFDAAESATSATSATSGPKPAPDAGLTPSAA